MGGGVSASGGELGLNERAWQIADAMAKNAAALRVAVRQLSGGARVIDAGIDASGGFGAGRALAEICTGGLADIAYPPVPIGGETWPGVLVLETRTLPTDEVAGWVGQKAGLAPSQLTFVVAPTASLAGGVQIVARILETGLHKMDTLGFDVNKIVSGIGTAPLPPVAKNDLRAIGRTNDCILYGGQARYTVRADDAELAELVPKIPASASQDYGTPFYDIFKRYDGDFYKIDPLLFSPAEVWLTSVQSGKTYHAGHVNPEVLRASLLES